MLGGDVISLDMKSLVCFACPCPTITTWLLLCISGAPLFLMTGLDSK